MSLYHRQRLRYAGARQILLGLIILFFTPRLALVLSNYALMIEIIGIILCCANCLQGCSEINRSNQIQSDEMNIDSSDENRLEQIHGEQARRCRRQRNKKSKRKSSSVSEVSLATFMESDNVANELNQDLEIDECLICSEVLKEKKLAILTCQHVFHKDCIDNWLKSDKTHHCPLCRNTIKIKKVLKPKVDE